MVATEAALWGSVKAHGFLPDTVIVSGYAGFRRDMVYGEAVEFETAIATLKTFAEPLKSGRA